MPVLSFPIRPWAHITVIAILADHLAVPSYQQNQCVNCRKLHGQGSLQTSVKWLTSTACFTVFIWFMWFFLSTAKTFLIISNISGLFLSRIFIRSFIAVTIPSFLSSAPCFELFSAAPRKRHISKLCHVVQQIARTTFQHGGSAQEGYGISNSRWRQSALSKSLHFSWHLTPHSLQRTPCLARPHKSPSHS